MGGAGPVLSVEGMSKSFGGLHVLRDLTFRVEPQVSTALIGPNGAGKTTVFNLISGVFPPDRGRIDVSGTDVTRLPSRRRVGVGIGRSFQNVRLMPHLTVLENLLVGQHVRTGGLRNLLKPYRWSRNHPWREQARAALAEAGLAACADEKVGSLPYGTRKRVDLIRATLGDPVVLMLDEPAAGLNETESDDLRRHLELLKARGITLLVIEHDMHFVGSVCDHVVVLDFGERIAEGTLAEVRTDARVRAAYLGQEDDA